MMDRIDSIFHIAGPADASRFHIEGSLTPASLAAEGFVHCSTAAQVVATTARHFDADADLVLIELDADALAHDLQWAEVYPGERFPHLHGPLPASAVLAVHPWGPTDRFAWSG